MSQNKSLQEATTNNDRFESDSQKVVRMHLEDKDHVISEDDIRNVRVGHRPASNNEHHLDEILEESTDTSTNNKEKLSEINAGKI